MFSRDSGPISSIQGVHSSARGHPPHAGNSPVSWSNHGFTSLISCLSGITIPHCLKLLKTLVSYFCLFGWLVGRSVASGRKVKSRPWLDTEVWHVGFPAATEGQGRQLFPVRRPNKEDSRASVSLWPRPGFAWGGQVQHRQPVLASWSTRGPHTGMHFFINITAPQVSDAVGFEAHHQFHNNFFLL